MNIKTVRLTLASGEFDFKLENFFQSARNHSKRRAPSSDVLKVRLALMMSENPIDHPKAFLVLRARVVERALRQKAAHYGQSVCASLDALVYINVDRVLRESADRMITEGLKRQGWRSVSAIIGASGIVLFTTEHAEAILRINEGKIKSEWPNLLSLWENA